MHSIKSKRGRKEGRICNNCGESKLNPLTGCMNSSDAHSTVYAHLEIDYISWTMKRSTGVMMQGLKDIVMSVMACAQQS